MLLSRRWIMSEEQRLLFDVVPPVFARRLLRQLPGRTREGAVALLAEMARRGLSAGLARKASSRERTDED
jgi:hypothetical protein